jgi:hypothetical protein
MSALQCWEEKYKYYVSKKYILQLNLSNDRHRSQRARRQIASSQKSSRLAPSLLPLSTLLKCLRKKKSPDLHHIWSTGSLWYPWFLSDRLPFRKQCCQYSWQSWIQSIHAANMEFLVSSIHQASRIHSCLKPPIVLLQSAVNKHLQADDGTLSTALSAVLSFASSLWAPITSSLVVTVRNQVTPWFHQRPYLFSGDPRSLRLELASDFYPFRRLVSF